MKIIVKIYNIDKLLILTFNFKQNFQKISFPRLQKVFHRPLGER